MKLNAGKVNSKGTSTRAAFTLIEMIGVLAVIAILAALLIPKVFNAINSARINSTAESISSLKTAVTDHYGKYGVFNTVGGTNSFATTNKFDAVLLAEGLLDKPFIAKIGTNWAVQVVAGGSENASAVGGYKLDGTAATSTSGQALIVEVKMDGVALQDAKDLNDLIDGTTLGVTTGDDLAGRVEYVANATTTVFVYLAGR